jgi:hypothetical protein
LEVVDGVLSLTGAETLLGDVESRATLRTAGLSMFGVCSAAVVVAAVIGTASATRSRKLSFDQPVDNGPGTGFAFLLGTGTVAALVGVPLTAQPDDATLSAQR